jgi:L-ascorbate metabolism protein UlaG (beta-lactamase superfamily)
LRVYFGGDAAYQKDYFEATGERFPAMDVALLPIAPIGPRGFMKRRHMDPSEALQAFVDLGARRMLPIHFDTFVNSTDSVGEAPRLLAQVAKERGLEDRVDVWEIGEQRVIVGK